MSGAELRAQAPALAKRVVDRMYQDPFWLERFGSRGRHHSEQDLSYHVDYVAQALDARDPGIITRYATWLRTVLTSRGMCTRHLSDSFAVLASELGEHPEARAMLEAASASLRYEAEPASAVEAAASGIVEAVLKEVQGGVSERQHVEHLLSYFADALASGTTGGLIEYALRIGPDLTRRTARHLSDVSSAAASLAARIG